MRREVGYITTGCAMYIQRTKVGDGVRDFCDDPKSVLRADLIGRRKGVMPSLPSYGISESGRTSLQIRIDSNGDLDLVSSGNGGAKYSIPAGNPCLVYGYTQKKNHG